MNTVSTKMEIAEDAYLALASMGYTEQRISAEAKSLLAARLFQQNILSLGKAAELSDRNLEDFINFLNELKIPVIDYEEDELDAEFKTALKVTKI